MMRKEIVTIFLWFLLSLYVAIESWRLGLGTFRLPGPGFLTFWVSIFVALLAILLLLKERAKRFVRKAAPLFTGEKIGNFILGFAFLFAYPLLLTRLGFFLCNLFFIGFCLKVIAKKKWGVTAGVSGGVALFVYLLFSVWLSLPLPEGEWVIWLFSWREG